MNQFRFPNRLKTKSICELFFIKLFYFFAFLSHLETSHFSYRGSVNEKPPLQSNEAQ